VLVFPFWVESVCRNLLVRAAAVGPSLNMTWVTALLRSPGVLAGCKVRRVTAPLIVTAYWHPPDSHIWRGVEMPVNCLAGDTKDLGRFFSDFSAVSPKGFNPVYLDAVRGFEVSDLRIPI
jgi:hypothetical protein